MVQEPETHHVQKGSVTDHRCVRIFNSRYRNAILRKLARGVINSDKRDFCPMVTPDERYFFFSSKRVGEGDIFWVDAKVIEALRDEF